MRNQVTALVLTISAACLLSACGGSAPTQAEARILLSNPTIENFRCSSKGQQRYRCHWSWMRHTPAGYLRQAAGPECFVRYNDQWQVRQNRECS